MKSETFVFARWFALIAMFFVIQAIVWAVAITMTANDSSHSVISEYDKKSIRWDEIRSIRQQSEKLGWKASFKICQESDIKSFRKVTLRLTDSSNQPISHAEVDTLTYHRAFSAKKQECDWAEVSPGVYEARVRVKNKGLWTLQGKATLDQKVFLIDCTEFFTIDGEQS